MILFWFYLQRKSPARTENCAQVYLKDSVNDLNVTINHNIDFKWNKMSFSAINTAAVWAFQHFHNLYLKNPTIKILILQITLITSKTFQLLRGTLKEHGLKPCANINYH